MKGLKWRCFFDHRRSFEIYRLDYLSRAEVKFESFFHAAQIVAAAFRRRMMTTRPARKEELVVRRTLQILPIMKGCVNQTKMLAI